MSYMKRKAAVLTALAKVNAGNLQAFWFSHVGVWGSATGTQWAEAPEVAKHPTIHRASR